MFSSFLKAHWFALLLSAGAAAAAFALPQANLTPVLLGLTVLVWGLTSALALRHSDSSRGIDAASDATLLTPEENGEVLPQSAHQDDQRKEERELVHSLFNDLHHVVQNEVLVIREDISITRELVSEAVTQLNDNLQGLYERSETQQSMLMSVFDNMEPKGTSLDNSISNHLSEISNLTNQFNEHIGQAVQSLQFEDIVSQRLNNPVEHLAFLERFVIILKENLDELDTQVKSMETDYYIGLQQTRDQLSIYKETWEKEDENLVRQQSMEAGSIDLF